MIDLNYNSELEFIGFDDQVPERPLADWILSFSGRKIQVVQSDLKGYTFREIEIPWFETAVKIALFVISFLTIIPAIVFAIQKSNYQNESREFLKDIKWSERQNSLQSVVPLLPHIIPKPLEQWEETDFKTFKSALANDLNQKSKSVLNFFRYFRNKEDEITLKTGDIERKVNKHVAVRVSPFFKTMLQSGMRESRSGICHTQFSEVELDLLASYINDPHFSSYRWNLEVFRALYKLADQLDIAEWRDLIVELTTTYQGNKTLFQLWLVAREFDDPVLMMRCARAYDLNTTLQAQDVDKEEWGMLLELKGIMYRLKGEIGSTDELKIDLKLYKSSLDELAPYLSMNGFSKLILANYADEDHLLECLESILENPDCSITKLKFQPQPRLYNMGLMEMINKDQKIHELDLANIYIGNNEVATLIEGLKKNHSLKKLCFEFDSSLNYYGSFLPLFTLFSSTSFSIQEWTLNCFDLSLKTVDETKRKIDETLQTAKAEGKIDYDFKDYGGEPYFWPAVTIKFLEKK
jgi:hypothetical protein